MSLYHQKPALKRKRVKVVILLIVNESKRGMKRVVARSNGSHCIREIDRSIETVRAEKFGCVWK